MGGIVEEKPEVRQPPIASSFGDDSASESTYAGNQSLARGAVGVMTSNPIMEAPPCPAARTPRQLFPAAGVRVQLAAAALMWLIGAGILIVRGIGYLRDEHWALWLMATAAVLGVLKSRMVLDRVARKAVARILSRGRAWFFGFFSAKSWAFVVLMMGGGLLLRQSGLHHGVLAVVYLGVGTALVLADRIFWGALLAGSPVPARQPQRLERDS